MPSYNLDNRPLSEIFAEIGQQYAYADAAAAILEDTQSAFLAEQIMRLYSDLPVNRAETLVKSSKEWTDRIHKKIEARRDANLLKVRMESIRMAYGQWQSQEANERVQARL